jgi:hypothetical protein
VTFLERRIDFHQDVLAGQMTRASQTVVEFHRHHSVAELSAAVSAQAAALSYADAFLLTGVLALIATPGVLLLARKRA